jgi:anti-sigma factor RsiW
MADMSHAVACERARSWAALDPDGSLSSFEHRLLATHLAGCADCAAFAAGVDATTAALRGAALVELPYPVTLPRRRKTSVSLSPVRALLPVAAAAAVALLTVSLGGVDGRHRTAVQGSLLVVVTTPSDERKVVREIQGARREQLVSENSIRVDEFRPGLHF